ncbi:MAG: TM0106 family RecB-like putative nuclease [Planctomycetota bacterium]|nr:TM0106 family RecB-like putative nuclease [Planctomycetota bacterium]
MKRITGTHVYSYAKCPRLAALDLSLSRDLRRPSTEWEDFATKRGRDFEADYVAKLGVVAPVYPERDFAAGAAATMVLLRSGVPLLHQAVLVAEDRLGLPDLLRRCAGKSNLGDHYYEVIDVKTSGRPRSDQILQVAFYSRLLSAVQGRLPEFGGLILKTGNEERFRLADYQAVASEVEQELLLLRTAPDRARPFRIAACDSCHWNHHCLPQLEQADDLSLVQGITHGSRTILEGLGCGTGRLLAAFASEGGRARGNLDSALFRRLRKAAVARQRGQPVIESRPRNAAIGAAAIVHVLMDPFADRVLCFGVLHPALPGGAIQCSVLGSHDEEWSVIQGMLNELPPHVPLLHFGEAFPNWYEEQSFTREAGLGMSSRFIDLAPRLRGAALYPGPVYGLADFVRHGLARDPMRAGHASAAALWSLASDGAQKLMAKVRADLHDLASLKQTILDAKPAGNETTVATDTGTAPA